MSLSRRLHLMLVLLVFVHAFVESHGPIHCSQVAAAVAVANDHVSNRRAAAAFVSVRCSGSSRHGKLRPTHRQQQHGECKFLKVNGEDDEMQVSTASLPAMEQVDGVPTVMDGQPQSKVANNNNKTITCSSPPLKSLLEKVQSYYPNADLSPICKAYELAEKAHEGQHRKSGDPYIVHPIGVANIIADLKLDVASVTTGLLHDTVEDTSVTLQDIEREFGEETAALVDGVTKIGRIHFHSQQERQAENYRKMIVAMAKDIRVILVKLADRTHNIRTLRHMSPAKQKKVARETLELYAPLAHRLGIYRLKTELEDTSLKYLHPKEYGELKKMVAAKQSERQEYTESVIFILKQVLSEAGVQGVKVTGRPKSFYSIYQKMKTQNLAFDDIHDITAFRVLVDDIGQCYQALGAVHAKWKPVPGRFKDYIALPKPNGYQSLHTTVIGPKGKRIEVQIRTNEMHEIAEGGIAAHWMYKGENKGVQEARRFTWLRQLVEWVQHLNDPSEFIHSVKEDLLLFEKEVFCFSPQGQLFALAKGSSVLDFAYRVHSDLGNHCTGAKVNGKMVPLKHELSNGDTVEILQSSDQQPRREWLSFVRTSKAKTRIRSWLKEQQRDESSTLGRDILDKELKRYSSKHPNAQKEYSEKLDRILSELGLQDGDHLLSALGHGQISIATVMNQLFVGGVTSKPKRGLTKDEKGDQKVLEFLKEKTESPSEPPPSGGVIVGGERNMLVDFCKNCSPLYGEEVEGVVTRGRGVKIHRLDCKYLHESDEERRIAAVWDEASKNTPRSIQLDVFFEDSPGMLASMSKAISSLGINIHSVVLKTLSNARGLARFEVSLVTMQDLKKVKDQLQRENGVLSVVRR